MNIEDLVILCATRCQMNPYDSKLINSFYDQISRGNGFTEKQANLALKILDRQSSKLNILLGKDIDQFLKNPIFRLGKRTVMSVKRMSVINHSSTGKAIKVEFPYNESLIEKIRKQRSTITYKTWDKDERAWIFSLNEQSIQFLLEITANEDFIFDEELQNYIVQIKEIENNLEKHVPILTFKEKIPKFENVLDNVPQPNSENILESVFFARKCGIQTWDSEVEAFLSSGTVTNVVKNFLNSDPGQDFSLELEKNSLFDISDVVKYLGPCIFIVPGGSEMQKTSMCYDFLKSIGFKNSEISVLFRLPRETGSEFNKFVKDNELNNPVTSETKVVFISSKIPKTIIDTNLKFNTVVNFNFYSVHYTIREFIKNHQNVIHVVEKKSQRSLNFDFL